MDQLSQMGSTQPITCEEAYKKMVRPDQQRHGSRKVGDTERPGMLDSMTRRGAGNFCESKIWLYANVRTGDDVNRIRGSRVRGGRKKDRSNATKCRAGSALCWSQGSSKSESGPVECRNRIAYAQGAARRAHRDWQRKRSLASPPSLSLTDTKRVQRPHQSLCP